MSEHENVKAEETQNTEQRLLDKEKCHADPLYRKGNAIYRVGMIILCVLLIINALLRLLKIEIVIGGAFCNTYLYTLIIIPCIMLVIGLNKTRKAGKQYNNYNVQGNTIWMCVMIAFVVLIALFCTADIITSPYNNAEVEDVIGRQGQNMKTVKINSADGMISFGEKEDVYVVEVYKDYGLFMKKIISSDPVSTDRFTSRVQTGIEENDYILTVNISGQSQIYEFEY